MSLKRVFVFAVFFFMARQSLAQATPLSDLGLYNRCYVHLTGLPMPLNDSRAAKVRAGTLSGFNACRELLQQGKLKADGTLANASVEGRAVLNQFYKFHRTWFPTNSVQQIADHDNDAGRATADIYDATEPSLALTRVLFAGANYSSVLTANQGMLALRTQDPELRTRYGWTVSNPSRALFGNDAKFAQGKVVFPTTDGRFSRDISVAGHILMDVPQVQAGELIGIRPNTQSLIVPNVAPLPPLAIRGNGTNTDSRAPALVTGLNYTFDLYKNLGGGILGQPIFLLQNLGHGRGVRFDGADKVPRRWVQVAMESLLCQQFPALRESDIRSYVKAGSNTPFRQSASCVRCHATLDRAAYTGRNVMMVGSYPFSLEEADGSRSAARSGILLTTYKPELASVAGWPDVATANFHRQTPSGQLFFRSHTGELINRSVTGIAGLGAEMSKTKDFYQCAAKRYFHYFTGIDVSLYDRTDPENAALNRALTSEQMEHRQFVEALATQLESRQSVEEIILNILASDYYRDKSYRPSLE